MVHANPMLNAVIRWTIWLLTEIHGHFAA